MPSPAGETSPADRSSRPLPPQLPIRGSSRRFPLLIWLFADAFVVFTALAVLNFRPVPGRDVLAIAALAAFALVGLVLVGQAVLATLRWNRFRHLALAIDPCPAEVGGLLAGSLVVPVAYDPANRFDLVLDCTEYGRQVGALQRNNSYRRQLFRAEAQAQALPAPDGTRLYVRLPIPPEAPASDGYGEKISWTRATAGRIYVRWGLQLSAEIAGVDLAEEFEIPMRRTTEQERSHGLLPEVSPKPSSPLKGAADAAADTVTASSGKPAYVYERIGNRIRVTQPAWRKSLDVTSPASLFFGMGPSVGFMAMGAFVSTLPGGGPFGMIFLLVGAASVAIFASYLAHSLTVEVDDAGVAIESRVFGFRVGQETLARRDILAVVVVADAPALRGGAMITREVKVVMRDRSERVVAQLIPRERDAVVLRNLIASRLAVDATGSASVAQPSSPATARPGATRSAWGKPAVAVLSVPFFLFMAWPFLGGYLGFGQTPVVATPAATKPAVSQQAVAKQGPARQGEPEAIRIQKEQLAIAEDEHGANDPLVAYQLERLAGLHVANRDYRAAEPVLRRALAILEGHSHAHVRVRVGSLDRGFDREGVQRQLAWALWELRRYPEALAQYQAAYAMVADLNLEEGERNARLAYNSAGIMVNACSLKEWETADHAMAELKQRMQRLPEPDRQWLQYWVRTGEPRLASRRC